ncbi:MAG: FtsX-like permease family protein [Ruminiclostridium sp.]|nr:FtsX-like permease family protein [Ruminiclostridium sp.]
MRKNVLKKSALREIRSTLSRFLSIFGIVALGVGFFSGVKAASPDMRATVDDYLDDYRLADMRIVSTCGFDGGDIAAAQTIDGAEVYPSYFTDLVSHCEGRSPAAARLTSLSADVIGGRVNALVLASGRMPANERECLVDSSKMKGGPAVGSTVRFTANDGSDPDDMLSVYEYTIVGAVNSPMYIDKTTRGSTTVGNGSIESVYYIPEENFIFEYHTELYLRFPELESFICYSDAYRDRADAFADTAEEIGERRAKERYADIVSEADEKLADAERELADAQKEYDDKIADGEKELADGEAEIAENERKLADAEAEIAENEQKLADAEAEIAENEQKLIDAEAEIAENEQKLLDAEAEIAENERKLIDAEAEIAENRKKLEDGRKETEEGRRKLEDAESAYNDGLAEYESGLRKYNDGLAEYQTNLDEYNARKEQLAAAREELRAGEEALEAGKAELEARKAQLTAAKAQLAAALGLPELPDAALQMYASVPQVAQLIAAQKAIEEAETEIARNEAELAAARQQLDEAQARLDEGGIQLRDAKLQLNAARMELESAEKQLSGAAAEIADGKAELADAEAELADGEKKLADAEAELADGRKKLDDAKSEVADGWKELNDAKSEVADGWKELNDAKSEVSDGRKELDDGRAEVEDGKKELADAKIKLEDGRKELEDGKTEGAEKIADARAELDDAHKKLEDLSEPKWYVFTRDDYPGYTEYGENADRINNIAAVFPVFFIIVAMLVCLTTMSRMVEEQRVCIGTLKALGYGNGAIISKYMFYAVSATLLGCVTGCGVGMYLFPFVIITAYGMMYDIIGMSLSIDIVTALTASAVFTAAIAFTVWLTARSALAEQAAQLMRPKAPKNGKRILLEHITPIWKHFGFSSKVTARNLFRYKRKMFMTVIGIAGCTALLLTGLALYDSINDIIAKQFEDIQNYQGILAYDADGEPDAPDRAAAVVSKHGGDSIRLYQKLVKVSAGGRSVNAYISVPSEPERFTEFFDLRNRTTGEKYSLSGDSIYLDEKSTLLLGGLGPGGTAEIELGETRRVPVTVTAPFENHPNHYIYMTPGTYEKITGDKPEYNVLYFRHSLGTGREQDKLGEELLAEDGVLTVSFNSNTVRTFTAMLEALGLVIVVIIASAGLLAFVVTYNLTNINITERIREIATLKVLGFYDIEVDKYIFRENIILSLIGTAAGLVLGRYLATFVITTAEVDLVMFGRNIYPISYIVAAAATVLFSVLVTFAMHKRLRNVDMIEALKSVE